MGSCLAMLISKHVNKKPHGQQTVAYPTADISYRLKRISVWIPQQILTVARMATAKH